MNNKLRESIIRIFPEKPAIIAYRLSDAILDDFGDIGDTFEENWNTWCQIEDWQILKSDTFFSFAPPETSAYLIPRFILFILDDLEDILLEKNKNSGVIDSVILYLEKQLNLQLKNLFFTNDQIEVIKDFLDQFYIDRYGSTYR